MPFEVIGQHAEEDVRAHPIGQPVMDRTDLQINSLDAAERPLHQGQGFVTAHRRRVAEDLGRQVCPHDIQTIGCSLGGDLRGLAREAEGGVGDVEIEMPSHLMLVEDLTGCKPIAAAPRNGSRLRTAALIRARSRSVATSRSSRWRARSAARSALRQTTNRSPGKSGAVMLAMSRWSNSES
jgi:hypothetical protein